jgi:uncharacterized cupredoxin-like copper-binding protein
MAHITRSSNLLWLSILIATIGLASCGGGQGAAPNSPVNVQITLTEFKITSSMATFTVGTPYHFEVTNNGNSPHEFQIMPPATGKLTQDQVNKMALAGLGQNDLPAGATKTLDYTFTQAYPQGALEFACHLPGHYEGGMHVPIVVNK